MAASLTAATLAGGVAGASGGGEQAAEGEWRSHGQAADEQRFSPLNQINRQNVGGLGLAWWAEFDTDRGQEATPLVVDGVLFTTTAWSKVYAFDARTGRQLWSYDPKVPGQTGLWVCCDVVNRGVAYWNGKVYVGTLDGRLIALDARKGTPVWSVHTTDPKQAYSITGAPRVVKGRIVIGNAGADYGVRGYVSAYDGRNGKLAWRFYVTPNPKGLPDHAGSDKALRSIARPTWFAGAWKQSGGGGAPWDAITYDEKDDLVLFGTGNGNPWNREVRTGGKGDNLFMSSIVAVHASTGEYAWHYQTAPGDSWDFDSTQQIMMADLKIGGRLRHVAMQAAKNGFYYVIDAASGKLISAEKYIPLDWAEKVDLKTGKPVMASWAYYPKGSPSHALPGPFGGHNWQPMAYSPHTGLVYIPAIHVRGYYSQPDDPKAFRFEPGLRNYGTGERVDRPPSLAIAPDPDNPDIYGELIAWDPAEGRDRWRLRFPEYWRSGVLATGGDLVFHAVGHQLTAFDAHDGKALWRYETVAAPIAAPISYSVDGTQYVALMVGLGGAGALGGGASAVRRPGRLLVFRLNGHAQAAPYGDPPRRPPLDLSNAVPSHGDLAQGRKDYVRFCQPCHRNNEFLPNLARTPMILTEESLRAIVLDGAFSYKGMPSFKAHLNPVRVEGLRAFFLSEAARNPGKEQSAEPEH